MRMTVVEHESVVCLSTETSKPTVHFFDYWHIQYRGHTLRLAQTEPVKKT